MKKLLDGVTFGDPVVVKGDGMVGPDGQWRDCLTVAEIKAKGVKHPKTGQLVRVDFSGFADGDRVIIRFPLLDAPHVNSTDLGIQAPPRQ